MKWFSSIIRTCMQSIANSIDCNLLLCVLPPSPKLTIIGKINKWINQWISSVFEYSQFHIVDIYRIAEKNRKPFLISIQLINLKSKHFQKRHTAHQVIWWQWNGKKKRRELNYSMYNVHNVPYIRELNVTKCNNYIARALCTNEQLVPTWICKNTQTHMNITGPCT